jgi:hypothetical protein
MKLKTGYTANERKQRKHYEQAEMTSVIKKSCSNIRDRADRGAVPGYKQRCI